MAQLKDLIVNGVSRFIGKVYINDSHITTINNVAVTDNPKFTDTVTTVAWDATDKKLTKTINGTTSDVVTASTLKTDLSLDNVENKSSATIRSELTQANVLTALGYTPRRYVYDYEIRASKTYTNVIATDTTGAQSNFYGLKIMPTSYAIQWNVLYKVTATMAGISEANGLGKQVVYMYCSGMRDTYAAYAVWNEISNTSYRPIYYNTMYRAKSAGITNGYGHLFGVGLRSSYKPTTSANSRTITFEIIDYENCTPTFLDSMVKQSVVPGVGSTNYQGAIEFNGTTQGLTRSGSDSNTYDRNAVSSGFAKSGQTALVAGNIVVSNEGTYFHLKTGNVFDLRYPIVYCSAAVNADTAFAPYTCIPFTITTTQSITLTPQQPVYIKGTLSGTKFTPISTTPLTQTVPATADGYQYIHLGIAYGASSVYLTEEHPIFAYRNGVWRQIISDASTVMGHTVESNVPANAVFTDTTYSLATYQSNGLMSSNDKILVDSIVAYATKNQVSSHVIASFTQPSNQKEGDIWLILQEQ